MIRRISFLLLVATAFCACNTRASQPDSNNISTNATTDSDRGDTLTLLFVGDLMQHQSQIDAALQNDSTYDYDGCFRYVRPIIKNADVAIANLEVTLAGKPYAGYPRFSAPDDYLAAIKDAGFNILLTANNHSCDTGQKGIERTIKLLDSLRIPHLGTYLNATERAKSYPYILEEQSFRIALLNYTYGTNGLPVPEPNIVNLIDTAQILSDINAAKRANPDAIIACMHWGTEYLLQPDDSQKAMAKWLLQHGITHIIGNHPHVVEPIEVLTDRNGEKHVVVWSLGNFLSGMKAPNTDGGLMVWIKLVKRTTAGDIAFIGAETSKIKTDSEANSTEKSNIKSDVETNRAEKSSDTVSTKLLGAEYSLVWVSRPAIGGRKEYRLYPSDIPTDTLKPNEKVRMRAFLNSARTLFAKYNTGIKENINPSHIGKKPYVTEK